MFLEACLNGTQRKTHHPALPCLPEEVARAAADCRADGASAVHVHPKNRHGIDSLAAEHVDATVAAVRSASPGLPVGVTTGAWILADPRQRCAAVRSWTVLPDFASVNWHEEGADDVAAALLERGVGVEAGLWNAHALRLWLASPVRDRSERVLVELPDGITEQELTHSAAVLCDGVRTECGPVPILLHGEGATTWPAIELAARWGVSTRVGLEDTLLLPDGRPAADNAALVAAAVTVVGRPTQDLGGPGARA